MDDRSFCAPPWDAPFDLGLEMQSIHETATISGMFLAPLLALAAERRVVLPSARQRYVLFKFYPLREHAALLLETCERVHGTEPTRLALRRLGRYAPRALLNSTLGKVLLGSALAPAEIIDAMARAYALNVRPGWAGVVESGPSYSLVRLADVGYFLDSHHVGTFEGALLHARVDGDVTLLARDKSHADFLLRW